MRTAIVLPCETPPRMTPPRPYGASRQRVGRGSGPTLKRAIAPAFTGPSAPLRLKWEPATPSWATGPLRVGGRRLGTLPLLPAWSSTVTENRYEPSGAGLPLTRPFQIAV